jgi:hypothetical protein
VLVEFGLLERVVAGFALEADHLKRAIQQARRCRNERGTREVKMRLELLHFFRRTGEGEDE